MQQNLTEKRNSCWSMIICQKKPGLAGLKLEVDKLDIDKLEVTSVILIKLSDVLKNEVVKRVNTRNLLKKLVLFRPLILVI